MDSKRVIASDAKSQTRAANLAPEYRVGLVRPISHVYA
jgi:hypothetical protein